MHFGLRVADLRRSLAFYTALGYEVVGGVPDTAAGFLTMIKLPGDEFVTIELVHDPDGAEFVAQEARTTSSSGRVDGRHVSRTSWPVASRWREPHVARRVRDFFTASVGDPDGTRIEFVEWPNRHADGMTAANLPGERAGGRYLMWTPLMLPAITRRWISEVPSKIV